MRSLWRKLTMRQRACDGKKAYRSFDEALASKRAIQASTGELLHVYACKFCPSWHLGHRRWQKPVDVTAGTVEAVSA